MAKGIHRTSVSTLLGAPVRDPQGTTLGRVQEFAVTPSAAADHVSSLVISSRRGRPGGAGSLLVDVSTLSLSGSGELRMREGSVASELPESHDLLMLERDLLDQQIIDVHGHKVVRVNDVELSWESPNESSDESILRIQEVEIGLRGAMRRLLKGLPTSTVQNIASRFRSNAIPWEFVDLIDRDPARRVRLKVEQDRLSQMHPSDIADILEELAPPERQALFERLDHEVAAEALEEVKPKMQQALLEPLDSEKVAGIVEEMDPGAAADLLSELPEERSEAILEGMDPEERREVQDLLEFSGDSAAGRMTTEYVALPREASLGEAIDELRTFDGDPELLTEIYLLDTDRRLCAVIPLVHILLAQPGAALQSLPRSHLVSCKADASGRKVAELFDKYNLRSLPVVDESGKLVGVVHAEQVIALLRNKSS